MGWRGSHKRRNANGPTGQTLALEHGECQHYLALVRFQAAGVGGGTSGCVPTISLGDRQAAVKAISLLFGVRHGVGPVEIDENGRCILGRPLTWQAPHDFSPVRVIFCPPARTSAGTWAVAHSNNFAKKRRNRSCSSAVTRSVFSPAAASSSSRLWETATSAAYAAAVPWSAESRICLRHCRQTVSSRPAIAPRVGACIHQDSSASGSAASSSSFSDRAKASYGRRTDCRCKRKQKRPRELRAVTLTSQSGSAARRRAISPMR